MSYSIGCSGEPDSWWRIHSCTFQASTVLLLILLWMTWCLRCRLNHESLALLFQNAQMMHHDVFTYQRRKNIFNDFLSCSKLYMGLSGSLVFIMHIIFFKADAIDLFRFDIVLYPDTEQNPNFLPTTGTSCLLRQCFSCCIVAVRNSKEF